MSKYLLPLLFLTACPDPAATQDPNAPPPGGEAGPPADPNAIPGTPDPNAAPGPADPNATPGAGAPNGANQAGSRPVPAGFTVTPGQGVKLSGNIVWSGAVDGKLRVDFLRNPEGSPYPELMHSLEQSKAGPWSVEVPKDLGEISVVAFIDKDDNGPSPGEPMALYKGDLKIASQTEIKDINLELSESPDMGAFQPRNEQTGQGGAPSELVGAGPNPTTGATGVPAPGTPPAGGTEGAPPPGTPPAGAPAAPPGPAPAGGAAPAGAAPASGAAPTQPGATVPGAPAGSGGQ